MTCTLLQVHWVPPCSIRRPTCWGPPEGCTRSWRHIWQISCWSVFMAPPPLTNLLFCFMSFDISTDNTCSFHNKNFANHLLSIQHEISVKNNFLSLHWITMLCKYCNKNCSNLNADYFVFTEQKSFHYKLFIVELLRNGVRTFEAGRYFDDRYSI